MHNQGRDRRRERGREGWIGGMGGMGEVGEKEGRREGRRCKVARSVGYTSGLELHTWQVQMRSEGELGYSCMRKYIHVPQT